MASHEGVDWLLKQDVLPDLISNTLEVVKLTSIASVVALPELLFQARQAQSVTYNATPIMAAAKTMAAASVLGVFLAAGIRWLV